MHDGSRETGLRPGPRFLVLKFLEKKVNFYKIHPIYYIDVNDKYHYVTQQILISHGGDQQWL